jgi:hypothetical protein
MIHLFNGKNVVKRSEEERAALRRLIALLFGENKTLSDFISGLPSWQREWLFKELSKFVFDTSSAYKKHAEKIVGSPDVGEFIERVSSASSSTPADIIRSIKVLQDAAEFWDSKIADSVPGDVALLPETMIPIFVE